MDLQLSERHKRMTQCTQKIPFGVPQRLMLGFSLFKIFLCDLLFMAYDLVITSNACDTTASDYVNNLDLTLTRW